MFQKKNILNRTKKKREKINKRDCQRVITISMHATTRSMRVG